MASYQAKVVFLGPQGVGKTSLVTRYVGHMFVRHTSPTIGASFFSCNITIDEHQMKLLIWDTAGQERFRAMAPMYYRNTDAAVLVYDITSRDSYNDMKSWVEELKINIEEPVVMCVVGNKTDKTSSRAVEAKESIAYASSIGALFHETSALNCEGVEAVFIDIAQELIQKKLAKSASNGNVINRNFSKANFLYLSDEHDGQKPPENEDKSFLCC